MALLMIRHGSTQYNEGGPAHERTRGWANVPMDPQGHQQAQAAARMSAPYPLKAIISSDLDRAHTTAQYVSQQHPGVPLLTTPALRPWHVGNLTGHLYEEAKPILDAHLQKPSEPIAGGESFYDFAQRSLPLLQSLAERPELYGVVTHNWNVKLMRAVAPSRGTELDHAIMAQSNPVKPGHLLQVNPDYSIQHIKGEENTSSQPATPVPSTPPPAAMPRSA